MRLAKQKSHGLIDRGLGGDAHGSERRLGSPHPAEIGKCNEKRNPPLVTAERRHRLLRRLRRFSIRGESHTELAAGTPITCVGLQSHFIVGQLPNLQQTLAQWASLGIRVRITELDIRIPLPGTTQQFQTQASNYASVVDACQAVSACAGITIWGIDDGHSWLPNSCCPEGVPLLWNSSYQKKPAYDATANAFGPSSGDTQAPTAPTNLAASGVTSRTA